MILDNEEQRETILHALMSMRIEGDYEGIAQVIPKFTAVVEAVKTAAVYKTNREEL